MKSSPLAAVESEYHETLRQIDNINNAIAAGIWNSSTSAKLKSLEDAAEDLRQSVEMMKFSQAQLLDHDRVEFFLRRFKKGDRNDPRFCRHMIDMFVNAVYVFDDHFDLVTNNCEGNQRFPLEDLPDDSGPDSVSECSEPVSSGVPAVLHPNTQVTVFRIAI